MTENRLRELSEAYADSFGADINYRNDNCWAGHVAEAEDVLEWLDEGYMVVSRRELQRLVDLIDHYQNEYYSVAKLGINIEKLKKLIKDI